MKSITFKTISQKADAIALPLLGFSGLLLILAILATQLTWPLAAVLFWIAISMAAFTALVLLVGIYHNVTHNTTHI